MASVLILGGGFAGLVAAERLAGELGKEHQITIVSPNRDFTFYPALVHLTFGETEAEDIRFDLAEKMKSLGVRFVQGEALSVNPRLKRVKITGDDFSGEINYDYLIVAVGRRLATEKVGGFFEYAHHLLGVKAALKFREAIDNFTEGVVVLGLCPEARLPVPVCETAFALARKFKDKISDGKIEILVVFPESLENAFGGADLHKELEVAFTEHGIDVLYNFPVREITSKEVLSANKRQIKYDLLMLIPPFRGNAALRGLGASNEEDFLKVDGLMRVHDLDITYAVGDIAAFSGPKLAHMAVRQARIAAENVLAEIKGEEPSAQYYHEIKAIIDAGGANSIYLHYGIWDDNVFSLRKGTFWGWAKSIHDLYWQAIR